MITDDQDQQIERLQAQALKNIYGYKMKYAEMRASADVTTLRQRIICLRQRRIELCDKFAQKAAGNYRFPNVWLPVCQGRQSERRGSEHYLEKTARTDRLNSSALFYFRRRMNGKAGRKYGERNRQYRE